MTNPNVPTNGSLDATSSSLLQRVRAQERAGWDRLVRLYSGLVYRWCRQMGLQCQDAEDVGQEVFAAVFRKIAEFRREKQGDTFRGWLRVIARNKVNDHLRRRQTSNKPGVGGSEPQIQMMQVPAEETDVSESASDPTEAFLLAHRALDLLREEFPEDKWQAFYRVVVEGQAPADVASALGTSVNVVYLAKSRGLKRLREEFAELLDW